MGRTNTTLRYLQIYNNHMDAECITHMATGISENPASALERWRFGDQKNTSSSFGRVCEKALTEMMSNNYTMLKLGFVCSDPNWRNQIDKFMIRNVDLHRRSRKGNEKIAHDNNKMRDDNKKRDDNRIRAEKMTVSSVTIIAVPAGVAVWEVFDDDDKTNLIRRFIANNKRMPTSGQFQQFAKKYDISLPYALVGPSLKAFWKKLFDAIVEESIEIKDAYDKKFKGVLHAWSEKNNNWLLELSTSNTRRYTFMSSKQPEIIVSEEFAEWLGQGNSFLRTSIVM